ncbi:uncharacterized protein LOC111035049 isoform X2 [Myzus persicae]|uniref:uncharacterized protein LOC111035049 isoform X2 n=1 Tax=Myzus persicae TaxID=13164 RepID=UPI000B9389F0|nr:uncharacterized protein LOC111035049 isoform X2 [Myzus persicae]
MPRRCSVVKCTSFNKTSNVPLFKVYDSDFDAWNKIISKVNGHFLRKVTYVCAEHFCNDDFITNYAVPKCLSEDKEKLEKVRTPDRYWVKGHKLS